MGISTRNVAAGAALLMIFGLGPQAIAPPRSSAERGVRLALIRLNSLLSQRNTALIDEFVAADDTLLVGIRSGERAQGLAQIAAYFQQIFSRPETISYTWREVDVAVRGDAAWLHAEGQAILRTAEGERRVPYRLAAVLELRGGRWKWRLFQGSQPVEAAGSA